MARLGSTATLTAIPTQCALAYVPVHDANYDSFEIPIGGLRVLQLGLDGMSLGMMQQRTSMRNTVPNYCGRYSERVASEGTVFLPSGFFGSVCSISGRAVGSEAEKGGCDRPAFCCLVLTGHSHFPQS